jgi:hypothetical protein
VGTNEEHNSPDGVPMCKVFTQEKALERISGAAMRRYTKKPAKCFFSFGPLQKKNWFLLTLHESRMAGVGIPG